MSKNVKRFFVVCFAVLMLIVCAVPAFATVTDGQGYPWYAVLPLATAQYSNANTTLQGTVGTGIDVVWDDGFLNGATIGSYDGGWTNSSLGHDGVGSATVNVDYVIGRNSSGPYVSMRSSCSGVTSVTFYADNVFINSSTGVLTQLYATQVRHYGGRYTVRGEFYVYNENTNSWSIVTRSRTYVTSTPASGDVGHALITGADLMPSGYGNWIIIRSMEITFTPNTPGITLEIRNMPLINNPPSIGDALWKQTQLGSADSASELMTWFIEPVQAFFDTPIFGSVSLGDVLGVLVALVVTVLLLKFYAGG